MCRAFKLLTLAIQGDGGLQEDCPAARGDQVLRVDRTIYNHGNSRYTAEEDHLPALESDTGTSLNNKTREDEERKRDSCPTWPWTT